MGNGLISYHVTSHPGQLNLAPWAGAVGNSVSWEENPVWRPMVMCHRHQRYITYYGLNITHYGTLRA